MMDQLKLQAGVGMSGTLVPMSTGIPAGTHQNLKILGTAGYRVPIKFQFMPTPGYRLKLKNQMSWRAFFGKLIKGTIFVKNFFVFLNISILVQQCFQKLCKPSPKSERIHHEDPRDQSTKFSSQAFLK